MQHIFFFFITFMTGWIYSCSEEVNPFERITDLRPLGIVADQPIVASATTVNLEIVVALPIGQNIDSIAQYDDPEANPSLKLSPELSSTEGTYEEFGPLKIYTHTAQVAIPTLGATTLAQFGGVVRLSYGFLIVSAGKTEKVIGEIRYLADSSTLAAWSSPRVTIEEATGEADGNESKKLVGTLDQSNDERTKISWYVSSGRIKNRQAPETTWTEADAGLQTVILAAYAVDSRFFTYTVVTREI
ncbi:MAG: hypothetical protein OXT67_03245 [Zetaproteobacteria bacterium]|nr:hypothetical protein [Zetaproteobacteria bacterium]